MAQKLWDVWRGNCGTWRRNYGILHLLHKSNEGDIQKLGAGTIRYRMYATGKESSKRASYIASSFVYAREEAVQGFSRTNWTHGPLSALIGAPSASQQVSL